MPEAHNLRLLVARARLELDLQDSRPECACEVRDGARRRPAANLGEHGRACVWAGVQAERRAVLQRASVELDLLLAIAAGVPRA